MARFMRTVNGTEEPSAEPKEKEDVKTAEIATIEEQRPPAQTRQSGDVSIISASLKVTGNLESDAEIQLNGKVEGDVRGKVVTIGEGADITGSVYGDTVNVAGTINGKIESRTVIVRKTARSTGDIIHESLQIESGAYVDGHCRPQFGKSEARSAQSKPVGHLSSHDLKLSDKAASSASPPEV